MYIQHKMVPNCVVSLMAVMVAFFLTACHSQLDSLRVAPRLTHHELQAGKVALMPLSARAEEVPEQDLRRLNDVYTYAFDKFAPGIQRVPSKVVMSAIASDPANWDTVVHFADTQRADARALQRLSDAVGARYLVFSRIEYAEQDDPYQSFSQWADRKHGEAPRTCGAGQPGADFAGNLCTASQMLGVVAVVDTMTGTAPWYATHHVGRELGNNRFDSNAVPLALSLFGDMFSELPRPN